MHENLPRRISLKGSLSFGPENNFYARNIKLCFTKKIYIYRYKYICDWDCHWLDIKVTFACFETNIFRVQDSRPVLNRNSRLRRLASCEKRDLFSRAPELVFSAKPSTGSRDWLALFRMLWKETRLCREMKLRDGLFDMCCKIHSARVLSAFFFRVPCCSCTVSLWMSTDREWRYNPFLSASPIKSYSYGMKRYMQSVDSSGHPSGYFDARVIKS